MASAFSLLCRFYLLLESKHLELKGSKLVPCLAQLLLDGEQAIHEIRLVLQQIALAHALYITIRVNAQRGWRHPSLASLPPLLPPTTVVGQAVLAVVGMGLRIANDRRLFDALALRVHFGGTGADGLKRDRLPFFEQLIDGRLDQAYRPLAPGLVVLLQPRTAGVLLWIRYRRVGHTFRPFCTPG
jgi:hypothetical protein